MSFADLRKQRANALSDLTSELAKVNQKGGGKGSEDTRFWTPTIDKEGNGMAIIRFLPSPENETVPFVRVWDHGFQGPGGWYIEKSRTTIGEDDPVSEYNSALWATGNEDDKKIASSQKRRLKFISNIYVVSDPGNPANNGKVFLYSYGKKIFDKLNDLMNPSFADETAINPFDLWEGANFRLRIRKFEGYRNYDKSEFDKPSAILPSDEELEAIWKSEYPLQAFIAPSEFKSYAELKARLEKVLGSATPVSAEKREAVAESYAAAPNFKERAAESAPSAMADDDDDDLAFFRKLREDN